MPWRSNPDGRLALLLVNTPTMPPIGADTWIHAKVIQYLDRDRFDVHVALDPGTPDTPTPFFKEVGATPDTTLVPVFFGREITMETGVRKLWRRVRDLAGLWSFAKLAVYVHRHHIAVIHTVSRPRDALACVLLARLTRTKCVIHMQLGYASWMSAPMRWSIRHADGVVAISRFVEWTLTENQVPPERIHLAYNAVVLPDWTPAHDRAALRRELGLPLDGPMVVTVCRLFPSKGVGELICAMHQVVKKIPDARLVVVGRDVTGSNYLEELQQLTVDRQFQNNVTFIGWRSDVVKFMGAADVFAMPSTNEPFGIVFAEAQAMEIPVVALDNGGTPEVVDDHRAGLLSPAGDIDSLTTNLLTLLDDPELRAEMGRYGRQQVATRFTVEMLADEMARIYDAVGH
jgi:glycosyltransferase involved in cell wall biosynthesis